MPIDKKDALDKLISIALQSKEFEEEINKDIVSREFLVSTLKRKEDELWGKGAEEIEEVNELERTLVSHNAELTKLVRGIPSRSILILRVIRYSLMIIVGLLIFSYIVSGLLWGWGAAFEWSVMHMGLVASLVVIIVPIMIIFLLFIMQRILAKRNIEQLRRKYNESFDIVSLRDRIDEAKKAANQAILERGIMPELRSIINEQSTPSYDTFITALPAPGLTEIFDPAYEIPTESKYKLIRLLNTLPGGSIGVAGPRGAGKTTLLRSVCMPSNLKIKNLPVLSIMISAPVEYDARDFILHLFSSVCMRALTLKNASTRSPWESVNKMQDPLSQNPLAARVFRIIFTTSATIGITLLMIGILLLFLTGNSSSASPLKPSASTSTPSVSATPISTPTSSTQSSNGFLTALAIEPGPILLWGIILTVIGMVGSVNSLSLKPFVGKLDSEQRDSEPRNESSSSLVKEAWQWLDKIRFQQSYSSGWSGTLKLPVAVEGSVNSVVTLAQNQLSLPEIIDYYRNFVKFISRHFAIIIGIDELDKLESDEKAQRFLNEIKGLFGLENCFYLISVSESALSSFERRGLPFRDVFDSSFDILIPVDYLTLEVAEKLLRRRVMGLPVPFLSFCYSMSGGLARDLIRICRDLLDHVQVKPNENDLATLCSFMIKSDIKSKLHAVSFAAKNLISHPEAGQFFDEVRKLEYSLEATSQKDLLQNFQEVFKKIKQIASQQPKSDGTSTEHEELSSLSIELAIYLYYSETLLEFFQDKSDSTAWRAIRGSGKLDMLARARQDLAVNPHAASSIITNFRKEHGMEALEI